METLLLAQTYEPLERVTWRRAMTLWVSGRVDIIEEYDDRWVRGVRTLYALPSVIRYRRSSHYRRGPRLRFSRAHVYVRDNGVCQYCGADLSRREGTYDHVVPRSRGGSTGWDNIVLACRRCNQSKGARTPAEARMSLIASPRPPRRFADVWRIDPRTSGPVPPEWLPYLGVFER